MRNHPKSQILVECYDYIPYSYHMVTIPPESATHPVRSHIKAMERGTVFLPDGFPVKDRAVLRVILSRLVKEGLITRIAPGLYLYPRPSPVLGTYAMPSLDDVARALASHEKANIAYSGVHALNRLGLSTQVPTKAVYLTDGSSRKITLEDGRTLLFKKVAAKNFAYTSTVMQMIVFALREIGEKALTEEMISRIRRILSTVPADDFHADIRLAPEWIQKNLMDLMEDQQDVHGPLKPTV
jgi:hypothetical protein